MDKIRCSVAAWKLLQGRRDLSIDAERKGINEIARSPELTELYTGGILQSLPVSFSPSWLSSLSTLSTTALGTGPAGSHLASAAAI